jgi:POT family proton-dependent oligopeptide transporter
MRNEYGWGYAFGAAGVGMFLGIMWFLLGDKHIKHADVMKPANPEDMPVSKVMWFVMIPMLVFGIIGWFIPGNIFGSDSTDAFIVACIPVISFYVNLLVKSNPEDKSRIGALLAIFAVVVVFWAVFKQNSSALTIYAETYTDRQIGETTANIVQPFGMVVEVTPPNPYFDNLDRGDNPAPQEPVKLISTEIFQSINPFFIILLTPVVISFFSLLRKRGKEPSTPAKIGYGLLITGLSTAIMAFAIYSTDLNLEKSSAWWLIGSYAVVTIGELFLSPIGLSLVSKVAPARLTSLMMGGWFLATSIGNKLSGVLASLWDSYEQKANFFWVNFIACMLAGLIVFAMIKWLREVINKHA